MKHSDHFVEGMTNIKGIQEDLISVKDISSHSKTAAQFLKEHIAKKIA